MHTYMYKQNVLLIFEEKVPLKYREITRFKFFFPFPLPFTLLPFFLIYRLPFQKPLIKTCLFCTLVQSFLVSLPSNSMI